MKKAFAGLGVAVLMTGCATFDYPTKCELPLVNTASPAKIASATKMIRDTVVYTERVYFSKSQWVIFANTHGRSMSDFEGTAQAIIGQGNFLKERTLPVSSMEYVDGKWAVSQTHPKCFALMDGADQKKGFYLSGTTYPFKLKDERNTDWQVEYFDLFDINRLGDFGNLTLTHKEKTNNLSLAMIDGEASVNGQAATIVKSTVPVFSREMLTVTSTQDTYEFIGFKRENGYADFYVVKNGITLLVFKGPDI